MSVEHQAETAACRENIGKQCEFHVTRHNPFSGVMERTDETKAGVIQAYQGLPFQTYVVKVEGVAMPYHVRPVDVVRMVSECPSK